MTGLEAVLSVALVALAGGLVWMYRRVVALGADIERLADQQRALRARQDDAAAGAPTAGAGGAAQLASLTGMAAQVQQAADELGVAVAARQSRLQELLAEADRRIADLAGAAAAARSARLAQAAHGGAPPPGAPAAASVTSASAAASAQLVAGPSAAAPASHGAPAAITVPGMPAAASYEEVRRLAAEGLDPAEIAKRTHRGREEVRLLLQLGQSKEG